jgi:2-polyprenyl-3-methyl-5-hydroxy-6-metoxy-1,4-benzoquinol methylase
MNELFAETQARRFPDRFGSRVYETMTMSNSVFHSRAVRSTQHPIENDPDPMVHQQLARLLFIPQILELKGKRVLEFGCGSGLNCSFLQSRAEVREIVGFDVSRESIALAKKQYPDINVLCADACDRALQISPGYWDVILSFEVLEHVPNMSAFVENIRRHLAPGGVVFLSTPNRTVFSLGHEPSPLNREHIKELSVLELKELLSPSFAQVEIWGQRFKRKELQEHWNRDVAVKIKRLQDGTRWTQPRRPLQDRLMSSPLIHKTYQNEKLRNTWKYLRWELWHSIELQRELKNRPYTYSDFEFDTDMANALWTCAKCQL